MSFLFVLAKMGTATFRKKHEAKRILLIAQQLLLTVQQKMLWRHI